MDFPDPVNWPEPYEIMVAARHIEPQLTLILLQSCCSIHWVWPKHFVPSAKVGTIRYLEDFFEVDLFFHVKDAMCQ